MGKTKPDWMIAAVLKVVDGRPSFAKPSIDGGKQEEIAVIDPDFE